MSSLRDHGSSTCLLILLGQDCLGAPLELVDLGPAILHALHTFH
jgi:hypothetical protein